MEYLNQITETDPDKNGIFTRTEFKLNNKNQIVKVVSTIKKTITKKIINKNVEKRRNEWKPFGLAATTNNKVTFLSDELVFMEPPTKFNKTFETPEIKEELICKLCNENHWTRLCPNNLNEEIKAPVKEKENKKYEEKERKNIENTIEIKDLSKNIGEFDLLNTCNILECSVKNIIIIKSGNNNFGFITFGNKKDMEKYIKIMDNYGYDHLKMKINPL
jgi:hypothetical protein